ncbi:MAG TPA: TraB/GumN family protein [Saprospiraceae bacterium]|nr:TraB/GumN family protein [Saprospiraceae bacterium]HND88362.1 TraB/GumN family protein [Saprospiraceae bacterium]
MHKLLYWLLPSLLFWVGCKSSEKAIYAPDQVVPTDKALLWKINGNGLKKPSYLYGTIHLIPKNQLAFSEALLTALDGSKRVAFEIDMRVMTNFRSQMGLMTKAFMAGGTTLKDLLPPDDYALVKEKMAEKGLPSAMFERMKPMFLSTLIAGEEDGGATLGGQMTSVEMELFRLSRKRRMESAGLETADYQMSVFDSIPYEAQAKMLVQGIRSVGADTTGENELEKMIGMYLDQDISAMQAMISAPENGMGGYEDVLLNRRNRNWIPVMGKFMRDKPTLFAVGAGHLGGPSGVVALLRKEGYRVEPAR